VAVLSPRMSFSIFLRWLANSPASCSIISFLRQAGRRHGSRPSACVAGCRAARRQLHQGAACWPIPLLGPTPATASLPGAPQRRAPGVGRRHKLPVRPHVPLLAGLQAGGRQGAQFAPTAGSGKRQGDAGRGGGPHPPGPRVTVWAAAGLACSENRLQPAPIMPLLLPRLCEPKRGAARRLTRCGLS
jgi:hypothetical protein